ncbi:hypothetical protein BMI91_05685 [Thioclava sediminum]|uniref:Sulfotransferase domain-containing protein n=1 Tax=Thioclava sediminum TaxID=1915319 RepID=A0ABX3N619_9RHOB|nr:sulfotransferase [Thioclava sediminum]OOY25879.1 hypothetical protein BMI91_05685 [Thioclava sediminum]
MPDRTPNLLVIGAMKAGTTTLCEELARHPDVWFPAGKEPNGLARHLKGEPHALDDWRALFSGRRERWLGDGSTGNSKVPFNPDTSGLAAGLCGPDTKILYITRDPIARTERHIAHEIGNGTLASPEGGLFSAPEYLANSAYAMQLSFWRRHFCPEAILEITLEDLTVDRAGVLTRVFSHLGLDPAPVLALGPVDANRGDARRSAHKSWLRPLLHSRAYARLRELLPRSLRQRAAGALLPTATQARVRLSDAEQTAARRALDALNALDAPDAATITATIQAAREAMK